MKKLFAALLALTMILGSMPVMADDPSLLTIGSGAEVLDSSAESIVPIGTSTSRIPALNLAYRSAPARLRIPASSPSSRAAPARPWIPAPVPASRSAPARLG